MAGQDGSYLAELLLEKGYEVFGLVRNIGPGSLSRIAGIVDRLELVEGDIRDQDRVDHVVRLAGPDEVYNLASQSYVSRSWAEPILTVEVNSMGTTRLLEAVRRYAPQARYYQASSSEMFGRTEASPLRESTPFHPRSPYAVSKVFGHHLTINYRENHGMFACSGICFNHESQRRDLDYVTRKITRGAVDIKLGLRNELRMGNLKVRRDWGYAPEYVEAMWLMLQGEEPDDYAICTGRSHSVGEAVEIAFAGVDLDWRDHVVEHESLYRPGEVNEVVGDPSHAASGLGWRARTSFADLIGIMVEAELELRSIEP